MQGQSRLVQSTPATSTSTRVISISYICIFNYPLHYFTCSSSPFVLSMEGGIKQSQCSVKRTDLRMNQIKLFQISPETAARIHAINFYYRFASKLSRGSYEEEQQNICGLNQRAAYKIRIKFQLFISINFICYKDEPCSRIEECMACYVYIAHFSVRVLHWVII